MKINEFIEEFNNASDKEKAVKKHVINSYVPFENKIALANNLVKKVMTADNGDLVRNTPSIYMNYVLALLSHYTDIEVSQEESLDIFNLVEMNGVTAFLASAIGEDAGSLDAVIKMTVEDAINNHCDLVNFMTIKSDNVNLLLDKAEEVLKGLSNK